MFCMQCGRDIADASSYCSYCGAPQRQRTSHKRLTLSIKDKKIAGVCGGLAEYLDVDSTVVRLIWVALSVVPGGLVGGHCRLRSRLDYHSQDAGTFGHDLYRRNRESFSKNKLTLVSVS